MGVPSIEKCPAGLDLRWAAVWRLSRDELKAAGMFTATSSALLTEMVQALAYAESAREADEDAMWDRRAKRAAALADLLGLAPRKMKVKKTGDADDANESADPFAGLDELAAKRAQTA